MENTLIPEQKEFADVAHDVNHELPISDEILENFAFWFNLLMIKGSNLINTRNAVSKPLECTESEV